MELSSAIEFARVNTHSVLVTIRGSGRPQMSNVLHHVYDDGIIRVSITADRAKYKNLVREPWAALHVTQSDFWAYAVLEGAVELTPVATRTDDCDRGRAGGLLQGRGRRARELERVPRVDGCGPSRHRAFPAQPCVRDDLTGARVACVSG